MLPCFSGLKRSVADALPKPIRLAVVDGLELDKL